MTSPVGKNAVLPSTQNVVESATIQEILDLIEEMMSWLGCRVYPFGRFTPVWT